MGNFMQIIFKRDVLIEVEKTKLEETWDKQYRKWDVLNVEIIAERGSEVNICTAEGDVLWNVPKDAFVKKD